MVLTDISLGLGDISFRTFVLLLRVTVTTFCLPTVFKTSVAFGLILTQDGLSCFHIIGQILKHRNCTFFELLKKGHPQNHLVTLKEVLFYYYYYYYEISFLQLEIYPKPR